MYDNLRKIALTCNFHRGQRNPVKLILEITFYVVGQQENAEIFAATGSIGCYKCCYFCYNFKASDWTGDLFSAAGKLEVIK